MRSCSRKSVKVNSQQCPSWCPSVRTLSTQSSSRGKQIPRHAGHRVDCKLRLHPHSKICHHHLPQDKYKKGFSRLFPVVTRRHTLTHRHARARDRPPSTTAERWPRTKEQGCKWPFAFPSLVPEETGDSGTLPRRSPPRRPVAVRPSSDTPGVERPLSVPPTAPPAMTPLSVFPEPSRGTCGCASETSAAVFGVSF